ncbi:hypothetical protein [Maribacter aquivivus]|uniref:hypothetical protein n=1 Tax=Maribacter aquivivus TaxID=228958 RepID=UPI002492E663|nr:hypothetical protein [Maribacter aquivivus]
MNKFKAVIILLFFGQLLISSCGGKSKESNKTKTTEQVSVILDLTQIANKTEKEVEKTLNKAEKSEIIKGYPCEKVNCKKALYKSEKIEIIFKEGKANRITINGTSDLTDMENALELLGLKNQKPTFKKNGNVIRWKNVKGIAEISCFTDYILINVKK